MGRFGRVRPHPNLAHLFFSILKPILFKKLIGQGGDEKIPKPVPFIFDFCFFIFIFLYFIFYFYYIKITIFHKK